MREELYCVTTPYRIIELGLWEEICEVKGYDPYCINEGTMDGNKKITIFISELTPNLKKILGLDNEKLGD